jgi:hypothetical protein
MSWRERLPWRTSRRETDDVGVARTPFVLLERRDLSPEGSAVLAQVARRYTVVPVVGKQRYSFRVGVSDAGPGVDAAEQLVAILAELDTNWEEHFAWPHLLSGTG